MTNVGTSSLELEVSRAHGLMSAGRKCIIASQSAGLALNGEGQGPR